MSAERALALANAAALAKNLKPADYPPPRMRYDAAREEWFLRYSGDPPRDFGDHFGVAVGKDGTTIVHLGR